MRNFRRICLMEREVISREIKRNRTGFYYVPVTANNKARRRCYRKPRKLAQDNRLRQAVLRGLRKTWSPSQISARLKADYPDEGAMRVSAETIYTYLYVLPRGGLRKELLSYLRQHRCLE